MLFTRRREALDGLELIRAIRGRAVLDSGQYSSD